MRYNPEPKKVLSTYFVLGNMVTEDQYMCPRPTYKKNKKQGELTGPRLRFSLVFLWV